MRRPALPADLATMTPAAICRAAAYDAHEQATAAGSSAEQADLEATARRWELEADARGVTIARLGPIQIAALVIYVFDPIFDEDIGDGAGPFPGRLDGAALVVDDVAAALDLLGSACNSADNDKDRDCRRGLEALHRRLRRAPAGATRC